MKELQLRGLSFTSQKIVVIEYKGFRREEPLRYDVFVEGCVLVLTLVYVLASLAVDLLYPILDPRLAERLLP